MFLFAVGNYDYATYLNNVIDSARRSNITNIITARNFLNRAARRVVTDLDLRSCKRKSVLATDLFDDIFSYPAPTDLKDTALIDLDPQINRSSIFKVVLTTEQEFQRRKEVRSNIVSIATDELVKRILFSGNVDDTVLVASTLDSLTAGGGTWSAFGNASGLVADADNRVKGAGSLKFSLTSGGTTAGIQNTSITAFDISDFTADGHVYVWVYITATANITNFILDVGNDLTTNYYSDTVTTQFDSTAFVAGWNLLRFDFDGITENGTVTDTAIDSIRLYMTKTSGKTGDGYRFDHIEFHTGEIHNVLYYSRFPWQTSAGAFLENSTADTDLLNAETDEFDGFVYKGKVELFRELRRFDLVADAEKVYQEWRKDYETRNPSERLQLTRSYYRV